MNVAACGRSGEPVVDAPTPDGPKSPNIVWVVADQPFGGTSAVETLLDSGVRYTQTRSVASPASTRAALLTGLYPEAIGIHKDRLAATPPAGVTVLPEQLRRAGYYTSRSGSAHHNLSLRSYDSDSVREIADLAWAPRRVGRRRSRCQLAGARSRLGPAVYGGFRL